LQRDFSQNRPRISTSGGSANILTAFVEARERGPLTLRRGGYDGGRIVAAHLVDHDRVVRSDDIPRIQEVQDSVYHVMRGIDRGCAGALGLARVAGDTANVRERGRRCGPYSLGPSIQR